MHNLVKIFAALALLGGGLGLAAFILLIGQAKSAPQEASISAMILAPVICLYVFARGLEMISNAKGEAKAPPAAASESKDAS